MNACLIGILLASVLLYCYWTVLVDELMPDDDVAGIVSGPQSHLSPEAEQTFRWLAMLEALSAIRLQSNTLALPPLPHDHVQVRPLSLV